VLLATPEGWPQATIVGKIAYIAETGDDYHFVDEGGFAHFFTSAELQRLFVGQKVKILQMVGLEGFNSDRKTSNDFAAKHPEDWKKWLEIHDAFCTDPFVVDASGHMMIIVRKD
jgi:hypothetical protein